MGGLLTHARLLPPSRRPAVNDRRTDEFLGWVRFVCIYKMRCILTILLLERGTRVR